MGAWGVQPNDFWDMSAEEFWWLHDVKTPRDPKSRYAGGMTEEEVRELYEMQYPNG